MKLFIDANILVSVVNKEYPLFTYSARILSLAEDNRFELFTSPLCLAIAFYFAQKKNKKTAMQKIDLLARNLNIAPADESGVRNIASNSKIKDYEDGIEYYAAMKSRCQCIITEDVDDFYFSEVPVLDCASFFRQYLLMK